MADPQKDTGDDIDALLAQLQGSKPAAPAQKPATKPLAAADPANDLAAQLQKQAGRQVASSEPLPPGATGLAPAPSGSATAASAATAQVRLSEPGANEDIDAILAELSNRPPTKSLAAGMPAAASGVANEALPVTSALTSRNQAGNAQTPAKPPTTREDSEANALLPSDVPTDAPVGDTLDAVLNSLPASKVHSTKRLTQSAKAQLGLSQEDIASLIAKHGEGGGDAAAETMISQNDIDALVKQLSAASSKGSAGAALRTTGAIARAAHGGTPDSGRITSIAAAASTAQFDGRSATGTTSMTDVRRAVAASLPPVMARHELRATRWLLAATVLLLAVCAVTMGVMAMSMQHLGSELLRERADVAAAAKAEDVGVELKAGLALIASSDDAEIARGIALLDRIKIRHPNREDEVDLELARHFLGHSLYRQAAERYGAVFERSPRPPSDPAVHLEYAECLAALGDVDAALRRIYILLANEQDFRADKDANGRQRGDDEQRKVGESIARAQLMLGRLQGERLGKDIGDAPQIGRAEAHAAPAEHHP